MAHDGKIDRVSLRQYKADLNRDLSSTQFVRASESDRAYTFTQTILELLSFDNEGEPSYIFTGAGYDFPIEIYNKIFRFLENSSYYEQKLRSHDPELRATQDLVVESLSKIKDSIDSSKYRDLALDFRYVPFAQPGTNAYDKEIADQIKLIDDLIRRVFQLLGKVSNYSSIRL
ncbi:hypothetical protein V2J83_25650 [Pseudomonas alliivorans]|nr:hypothetical protein [Pseudomonas alliivorans]